MLTPQFQKQLEEINKMSIKNNTDSDMLRMMEDKTAVVYLPKLCFKLTESQKEILTVIGKGDFKTPADLAKKVKLSRAMLYRNLDEMKDLGYVETEDGIKLTDAGRIARL